MTRGLFIVGPIPLAILLQSLGVMPSDGTLWNTHWATVSRRPPVVTGNLQAAASFSRIRTLSMNPSLFCEECIVQA